MMRPTSFAPVGLLALSFGLNPALADPPPSSSAPASKSSASQSNDAMESAMASRRASLKDAAISNALSFYGVRTAVLERIAKEFPSLKKDAEAAQSAMRSKFGAGRDALLDLYLSRGGTRMADWEKSKEAFGRDAAAQELKESELKKAFAAGALAPQNQKLVYVLLFLTMDPAQVAKPEASFDDGFAINLHLSEGGEDEAFGSVQVPATFGLISGGKAGEPMTFAFAGAGPAVITITVSSGSEPVTPQKAIDNVLASAPRDAKYDAKKAKIVDTPNGNAALVPLEIHVDPGKAKVVSRGEVFLLPVGNRVVGVSTLVNCPEGERQDERATALLARFEPLFERIRKSICIK